MRALGALVIVAAACAACAAVLGVGDPTYGRADGGGDGGGDGGSGGETDGPSPQFTYHPLAEAGRWSTVHVADFKFGAGKWQGGAFDGRYVTFFPVNTAYDVLRYDTTGDFKKAASWDESSLDLLDSSDGLTIVGGLILGERIYAVSGASFPPAPDLLYYRSTAPNAAAWSSFDLSTLGVNHVYSASDGRYVYLVPGRLNNSTNGDPTGKIVRFDPTNQTSLVYDTGASLNAHAIGYGASAFDGRYVYFLPYEDGKGATTYLSRYDTHSAEGFTSSNAWDYVDLASLGVPGGALGHFGSSSFDGRYLYMWRVDSGGTPTVGRFDTLADFHAPPSWSAVTLGPANGVPLSFFDGATFDGRYVYAIAYDGTPRTRAIVRCDTTAPFAQSCFESVAFPDVTGATGAAAVYGGLVFDGRFVYVVPNEQDSFFRFDAREPAVPIALDGGSFY